MLRFLQVQPSLWWLPVAGQMRGAGTAGPKVLAIAGFCRGKTAAETSGLMHNDPELVMCVILR